MAWQAAIAAGVRAGLQPVVEELQRLRELLAAQPVETPACLHPSDQRVEFGAMGDGDEWRCRACGYWHMAEGAT